MRGSLRCDIAGLPAEERGVHSYCQSPEVSEKNRKWGWAAHSLSARPNGIPLFAPTPLPYQLNVPNPIAQWKVQPGYQKCAPKRGRGFVGDWHISAACQEKSRHQTYAAEKRDICVVSGGNRPGTSPVP